MGILGRRKNIAITAVGLLSAGLAGCSGAAPTVSEPSQPTTTSTSGAARSTPTASRPATSATAPTASQSLTQTQIEAAIAAGAPPKDLTWMVPKVPAHWKKLSSETGTLEWKTREGCLLILDQPSGIGTDPTPTSEDVLQDSAERFSAAFDRTPKPTYGNRTTRKLPNTVPGLHGTSLVTFREATVDYDKVRSQQLAYRNGDFALSFDGFCNDAKTFAIAKNADFEPFLTELEVHTRY